MYRAKDRKTQLLFPELFPFGGKLDERNRWLRIEKLVPWEDLEIEYGKAFSPDFGRPAKDAQLVIGLLLLKHMTGLSDRELIAEVLENPYMHLRFLLFSKLVYSFLKHYFDVLPCHIVLLSGLFKSVPKVCLKFLKIPQKTA